MDTTIEGDANLFKKCILQFALLDRLLIVDSKKELLEVQEKMKKESEGKRKEKMSGTRRS
jgi:hypothetical protein